MTQPRASSDRTQPAQKQAICARHVLGHGNHPAVHIRQGGCLRVSAWALKLLTYSSGRIMRLMAASGQNRSSRQAHMQFSAPAC